MASYFDEHDCQPLNDGQTPDHYLHLARLLRDGGFLDEFQELFGQIEATPPASKAVVDNLPETSFKVDELGDDVMCAVCRALYTTEDRPKALPCDHKFHKSCILPWLQKTNTCPECRYELPTDDESYEAMRKFKKRENQRKHDIETLHDSMFG